MSDIPTPETQNEAEARPEWFLAHEKLQDQRFRKTRKDIRGIHKRIDSMPTKADTDTILNFLKNMEVGVSIFKISSNSLVRFALVCASILGIARFWKDIVAIIKT
jgi:hypothetical protein